MRVDSVRGDEHRNWGLVVSSPLSRSERLNTKDAAEFKFCRASRTFSAVGDVSEGGTRQGHYTDKDWKDPANHSDSRNSFQPPRIEPAANVRSWER